MEKIPSHITVEEKVTSQGKTVIKKNLLDLEIEDLPVAATFESMEIGLQIFLVPTQSEFNPTTGLHEELPNTGVRIKFKGGKWQTRNSNLLRLVMETSAYKNGQIHIDPEDYTGFWRKQGFLEVKMVPVVAEIKRKHPGFDELNMDKLQPKENEKPVLPVAKVI